jgi:hypothetical protein
VERELLERELLERQQLERQLLERELLERQQLERQLLVREHVELMMRTTLPKKAVAFVAIVTAAGTAALAARLADVGRWTVADLGAAIVLIAATVAGERFSLRFHFGEQTKHVTVTEASFAAALLLGVRPSVLVLAVAVGVVISNAMRRTAVHKAAFNVGSFALALTAAAIVHRAAMPAGAALAVGAAMGAFFVVNAGTVVGVIALVEGRSFLSVFRPIARVEYLAAAGNAAAGVAAASILLGIPAIVLAAMALPVLALGVSRAVRWRAPVTAS